MIKLKILYRKGLKKEIQLLTYATRMKLMHRKSLNYRLKVPCQNSTENEFKTMKVLTIISKMR